MKPRASGALAVAAAVLTPAAVQAQTYGNHAHYWDGGWGWGHMIFGPLVMIVLVAVIIVLALLAVRWLGGGAAGRGGAPDRDTALDILAERYARGEIDREEFQRKKQDLS